MVFRDLVRGSGIAAGRTVEPTARMMDGPVIEP
jgi:hypothetical protein